MPAGEKTKAADWYKFHVKKKKVLYLDVATEGTGPMIFYLYGPSYKGGIMACSLSNDSGTYYSFNTATNKKLKITPGIYYIKVTRSSTFPDTSGVYSLRWR